MDISRYDIVELQNRYLPQPSKTYCYHFTSQITTKKKGEKDWIKTIWRKAEIVYLGIKEGYRLYQLLTEEINLKSDKPLLNKGVFTKIEYIFDYVEIGANDQGLIKRIFNMQDLKLKMKEIKRDLEKDHHGEEFEENLNEIIMLLQEEKRVIQFLQSNKRFGLYFNGLYQQFDKEMQSPKKFLKVLDDFGHIEIQEEVTILKDNHDYTFIVSSTGENDKIKAYEGNCKTECNQLIKNVLTIQNEEKTIKYNVSWVG